MNTYRSTGLSFTRPDLDVEEVLGVDHHPHIGFTRHASARTAARPALA
ncbi:hypothetical protein ACFV0H_33480 [Streptomyces erythrochromogenes]|uniref:Uncharacterized protein n=1 Tax=Streptomyces erythrochromogenes TaxID=285574 RepID=A0ABZ1Q4I9_9ACTN|nr:hypothetical protein [Streptomyces erythrochromogenes]MCX5583744.1 hypothetical protein [Streptomyces erythrochromogenes]